MKKFALSLVLLLLLAGLVARRLVGLWAERHRDGTGSGLHRRLALLFTIFTAARSGEVRSARWEQIDLSPTGRGIG